jgi:hypothetical protein
VSASCNLDQADAKGDREQASIFLDKTTAGEAYTSLLRGPSAGSGWLYVMERYVCVSDVGDWCIYCQTDSELAVIAVRYKGVPDRFKSAIQQFNALPIRPAIEEPPCYGLSPERLSPEWRNKLLQEYSKSL